MDLSKAFDRSKTKAPMSLNMEDSFLGQQSLVFVYRHYLFGIWTERIWTIPSRT